MSENQPNPSRLWKHMAETHNLPLLESEENDIRWACDESAMRQIAALDAVLVVRENEIERWRDSNNRLRAEMEKQAHDAAEYKRLYEQEQGEKRTILEAATLLARGANKPGDQARESPASPVRPSSP